MIKVCIEMDDVSVTVKEKTLDGRYCAWRKILPLCLDALRGHGYLFTEEVEEAILNIGNDIPLDEEKANGA